MKILVNEKLSSHKYKTPEGYLICTDAILARTGKQDYLRRELFGDSCENPDEIVWVDRKPEEVFDEATLSSFENKPITVDHPDENVNPSNYRDLAVGYVRDVRRDKMDDGTEVIKGNLVITDENTINEILEGEHTDLSCGYDCEILDEDNPQQRHIRGNHVALCEEGRAGVAKIVDSKMKDSYIEISKDEIDDEEELEIDCSNLRLECTNQGKYYRIRGEKKNIWKLLAMYNMNEKKKYIEDSKVKDDDESWFEMLLKRALKEHEKEFSSDISPTVANRVAKKNGVKISYIRNSKGYLYKYTYTITDSKVKDSGYTYKGYTIIDYGNDVVVKKGSKILVKCPTEEEAEEWIDENVGDSKMKDARKYVYEFYYPDINSEDKRIMKRYGLTVLGKSGKDRGEKNLAVMGDLDDLERYCEEWLGYEMHPDYLIEEEDFAYDMYDSKKVGDKYQKKMSMNDALNMINIIKKIKK